MIRGRQSQIVVLIWKNIKPKEELHEYTYEQICPLLIIFPLDSLSHSHSFYVQMDREIFFFQTLKGRSPILKPFTYKYYSFYWFKRKIMSYIYIVHINYNKFNITSGFYLLSLLKCQLTKQCPLRYFLSSRTWSSRILVFGFHISRHHHKIVRIMNQPLCLDHLHSTAFVSPVMQEGGHVSQATLSTVPGLSLRMHSIKLARYSSISSEKENFLLKNCLKK